MSSRTPAEIAALAKYDHLPRAMVPVHEIRLHRYGQAGLPGHDGAIVEPTPLDVKAAIDAGAFEPHNYSEEGEGLIARFTAEAKGNNTEYLRLWRQYHARRIAYLVVHGWELPIRVRPKEGSHHPMLDGTHRLKAAMYQGKAAVECWIEAAGAIT